MQVLNFFVSGELDSVADVHPFRRGYGFRLMEFNATTVALFPNSVSRFPAFNTIFLIVNHIIISGQSSKNDSERFCYLWGD